MRTGGDTTRLFTSDGGAEEFHGEPTVGSRLKAGSEVKNVSSAQDLQSHRLILVVQSSPLYREVAKMTRQNFLGVRPSGRLQSFGTNAHSLSELPIFKFFHRFFDFFRVNLLIVQSHKVVTIVKSLIQGRNHATRAGVELRSRTAL